MPVVTSIKPQKSKKRVSVYLDGKFGFGIDLENFMKLRLKVEDELSEEEVEKIVRKAEFQKVYDKLLKFVTLRLRSEKEINDWLRKHKVHKSLFKDLFNRLKRLELPDDEKFARWWVGQRMNFRPRAKRILNYELRRKGVDKNIIQDVLSEIKIDEEKIAKELLEKKKYRWKKLEKLEKRKKMSEFLGRKGFGWGTIKQVVGELLDD